MYGERESASELWGAWPEEVKVCRENVVRSIMLATRKKTVP